MPGLNACGLQSKLLIHHLVSEAILILLYCRYGQDHLSGAPVLLVWCTLKFVTTTLGYCLAGYIYCTAQ